MWHLKRVTKISVFLSRTVQDQKNHIFDSHSILNKCQLKVSSTWHESWNDSPPWIAVVLARIQAQVERVCRHTRQQFVRARLTGRTDGFGEKRDPFLLHNNRRICSSCFESNFASIQKSWEEERRRYFFVVNARVVAHVGSAQWPINESGHRDCERRCRNYPIIRTSSRQCFFLRWQWQLASKTR